MQFPKLRALILGTALLPTPIFAQAQDSETAYMRLHLASELRYETQYMARLACYIGANFNPEANRAMLEEAAADFEASLQALKYGDEAFSLPRESNARILAEVAAIRAIWPDMAELLGAIIAGNAPDGGDIAEINLESRALLERTESLSSRIATVNSDFMQDLPLIMTLSVDMAGRQIMRTEKAAKEACLIGSGLDPVGNRRSLQNTVSVFSATMDALIDGFPGMIVKPPTPEIQDLLEQAQALWSAPKAALSQLYTSGDISDEDRMVIGLGMENVVAKLDEVAVLYQSIQMEK